MITLENDFLKIGIRSQGAELTSIYSKKDQLEYLWQGDPAIWGWHAPNLFPVVGGSLDNLIQVNGQQYPINRHGFARTSTFRKLESTPKHAKFALHYNEDTLKSYPFKFEFQVLYDLFDNKLRISYKVINLDEGTIYFSVGAHPAFNVPQTNDLAYEDYYLEFDKQEPLTTHLLTEGGFFSGETSAITTEGNKLPLTRDLFSKDALVLKNLQSRKVAIKNHKHANFIEVSYPHFNYLGLWAKPGANFVCIEPWLGCADSAGRKVDIKEREAIQCAEQGHVFETDFCITIFSGV